MSRWNSASVSASAGVGGVKTFRVSCQNLFFNSVSQVSVQDQCGAQCFVLWKIWKVCCFDRNFSYLSILHFCVVIRCHRDLQRQSDNNIRSRPSEIKGVFWSLWRSLQSWHGETWSMTRLFVDNKDFKLGSTSMTDTTLPTWSLFYFLWHQYIKINPA